jgi:UDP-2,3-diacylglucosamine hydrolase
MATLFIADLHLSEEQPELTGQFLDFLHGPARDADALYILGDLFEAWLGDDLIPPFVQPILQALHALSDRGTAVYLMHGNRDFLLGREFCAQSGCTLLEEPAIIDLHGTPTLLMHGDLLCSDDHAYLALREQLRRPEWIAEFLAKPATERIAFARALRQRSRQESGQKSEQIMDTNPTTVSETMQRHGVSQLIHGHTHRPAQHRMTQGGKTAWRHVLPDWQTRAGVLLCDADGCRLRHLDELTA